MPKKGKGKKAKKGKKAGAKASQQKRKTDATASEPPEEPSPEDQARHFGPQDPIDYLKTMPVNSISIGIRTIHEVLLSETGIPQEAYDESYQRTSETEAAIRSSVAMVAQGINNAIQTGNTEAMERAAKAALAFASGREDVKVAAEAAMAVAKTAQDHARELHQAHQRSEGKAPADPESTNDDDYDDDDDEDDDAIEPLPTHAIDMQQIDDSVENITALYNGIQRILEQPFHLTKAAENKEPAMNRNLDSYSPIREAEALEASIMAAMPHDIAERVYDELEAMGCSCPAQCGQRFPIEELEKHCQLHLEEEYSLFDAAATAAIPKASTLPLPMNPFEASIPKLQSLASQALAQDAKQPQQQNQPSSIAQGAPQAATPPAGLAQASVQTAADDPLPLPAQNSIAGSYHALLAQLPDSVLLEDHGLVPADQINVDEMIANNIGSPLPGMMNGDSELALVLPRGNNHDAIEQQWANLKAWLYMTDSNTNVHRYEQMKTTLLNIHSRIAALKPKIDAKEQILGIRSQMETHLKQQAQDLCPNVTPDQRAANMAMSEAASVMVALDCYLSIAQRRTKVALRDFKVASDRVDKTGKASKNLKLQVQMYERQIQELRDQVRALQPSKHPNRKRTAVQAEAVLIGEKETQIQFANKEIADLVKKQKVNCQLMVSLRNKADVQQHREKQLATLLHQTTSVFWARFYSPMLHPRFRKLLNGDQALMTLAEAMVPPEPASQPALPNGTTGNHTPESATDAVEATAAATARAAVVAANQTRLDLDLQPMIDFERQEHAENERLMQEVGLREDEQAQLFDLMREAAYTDPIIHTVRQCFLNSIQEQVDKHRRLAYERHVLAQRELELQTYIRSQEIIAEELAEKERQRKRKEQQARERERAAEERERQRRKAKEQEEKQAKRQQQEQAEREAKQRELEAAKKRELDQAQVKHEEAFKAQVIAKRLAEQAELERRLKLEAEERERQQEQARLRQAKQVQQQKSQTKPIKTIDNTNGDVSASQEEQPKRRNRTSRRSRAKAKVKAKAAPALDAQSAQEAPLPKPAPIAPMAPLVELPPLEMPLASSSAIPATQQATASSVDHPVTAGTQYPLTSDLSFLDLPPEHIFDSTSAPNTPRRQPSAPRPAISSQPSPNRLDHTQPSDWDRIANIWKQPVEAFEAPAASSSVFRGWGRDSHLTNTTWERLDPTTGSLMSNSHGLPTDEPSVISWPFDDVLNKDSNA